MRNGFHGGKVFNSPPVGAITDIPIDTPLLAAGSSLIMDKY